MKSLYIFLDMKMLVGLVHFVVSRCINFLLILLHQHVFIAI